MTVSGQKSTPIRNIVGFALAGAVGLGLAYVSLVLWGVSRLLWSHTPIDMSVLRQQPWDEDYLTVMALIGGGLALELLANGWRHSPLRRVLMENRPSDRTDLFYIMVNITGIGRMQVILLSFGLVVLFEKFIDLSHLRVAESLSLWVAVPLVYILSDAVGYWGHRLMHTELLWPFHAVHHAAEDMTVLTTFRHHPIDAFAGEMWAMLPLGLLGFSPDAIMIGMTIVGAQVMVTHSNLPFPAWLEGIVSGPRAHTIHHAIDKDCHNTNFGTIMLYDRMFGTYRMQDVSGLKTGLADPFYGSGRPVSEMFAVMGRVFSNFRTAFRSRRLALAAPVAALLLAPIPMSGHAASATVNSIAAEGTQFRVALSDGRIMHSPELVGMRLTLATAKGELKIRITGVERDPDSKTGDVWLHSMMVEQPDGSIVNMCGVGPDGRQQGFPSATRFGEDGHTVVNAPEQFEILCTNGAPGKCVRWGYRPWMQDELALYETCTRMTRADYCGNGWGTTRNGMIIDFFDERDIQTVDEETPREFEAGWTTKGAVCVRHVRVKENVTLERLIAACPWLAGKVGDMCTEQTARSLGATMFNKSAP